MTTLTHPHETLAAPAASAAADSPEAADRARADGALLRQHAAAMRLDAEADVQTARAALAEAEQRQRRIADAAEHVEQLAVSCDTLGRVLDHGRSIGDQALKAEADLAVLALEREALAPKAAVAEARLGELAAQREGLEMSMARALEAGDVDALTQSRPQLAALDEIAEELRRRLAPVQTRLRELGDIEIEGTQTYSAAQTAASLRRSYGEFLNSLRGKFGDETMRQHLLWYLRACAGLTEQTRHAEVTATLREHPPFAALLDDVLDHHPSVAAGLEAA